ncbi:MAG: CBS domain-containing protein [Spirochaetes bacterium]|nr:CBS domain-containing protein [Spirochaetota bacterium]MBU1080327.1 CBS domain-containing protein [Spirochaetota bacterium]
MKASALINRVEAIVDPYDSVASVERELMSLGYLVVKDGPSFLGILVQSDVIEMAHSLVIDCVTPKPSIRDDAGLEEALGVMRARRLPYLPVVNGGGDYMGSVGLDAILGELVSMRRAPVAVSVANVIGPDSAEECKQAFIAQLTHHVKNPLQVIMSSASLLRAACDESERSILLDSIATSVEDIDAVIDGLVARYF